MQRPNRLLRDVVAASLSFASICAVVGLIRGALGITNPTTGALALLLVVLGTATTARLAVAIAASVAAMLAFNFFFCRLSRRSIAFSKRSAMRPCRSSPSDPDARGPCARSLRGLTPGWPRRSFGTA